MTIPVVWVSYHEPEIIARGYWDQGFLERLFDRRLWNPSCGVTFNHHVGFDAVPPDHDGAVVIVPAQHHAMPIDVARLNVDISRFEWCVVILTGDECSLFPWQALCHPNMRLWIMTPRPYLHEESDARFIGEGWHVDTPDVLRAHEAEAMAKEITWFFAGQITHRQRRECARALRALHPVIRGALFETPGFLQGLDQHDYLAAMASAKIAPCPSGPCTPDSFRLYEALEAGVLPLADATTPEGWPGYWPQLVGSEHPFPLVDDWADVGPIMHRALADWPRNVNRASAWWQQRKRDMAWWLENDIAAVSGKRPEPQDVSDLVTIVISTSPIPSHPTTAVIEETVASIRAQPDLAGAEIIIACDGVRPEQEHRAEAYGEYVRRLLWLTNHRWHNVVPMVAEEWLHQANLTRRALELVRTALVLFVEHDTPLCGPIPWGELVDQVQAGKLNLVRLHHEAGVLDEHRHLMVDSDASWGDCPVPVLRTMQWSQRPHLARADWYRSLLGRYFGADARTMIEDCMHGVVDHAWRTRRERGWEEWRLAIYAPPGDMKRSLHTDGRAGDDKGEMVYAYDSEVPEGAPWPTSQRVVEPA